MKGKLRAWRRRWCVRRGHEMVKHELCLSYREADSVGADGTIVPGREFEQWSMRCARHG